jgi:hypothetical protein
VVVQWLQQSFNQEAVYKVRVESEDATVERFRERVALMMIDGGLSEFDATRAAYFELRRAGGNVPHAVNEEWKRVGRLSK